MPRKESEAVPEGNGPTPMLGGITLEELRQAVSETWGEALKDIKEDFKSTNERVARLEQNSSAATSRHGDRRARRHQDSRAHGGRRQSSSSEVLE